MKGNTQRHIVKKKPLGFTGIPREDLIRAANMFGSAERGSFLYAMGITQHRTGTDNVKSVANLTMLTGRSVRSLSFC